MTARGEIYDSRRLAHGYAFRRPPVHPRVIAMVADDLHLDTPVARALDVGCGAGLSTAAVAPIARLAIGLEPAVDMLTFHAQVAPSGAFVAGRAEALPLADRSVNLVTAAGALNYVDLTRFLPEAARVLRPDGTLVVYDFSSGRRIADDEALERWFAAFESRYPFPPGYAFDLERLNDETTGFRVAHVREFAAGLPMTGPAYLDYVMTETSIEQAIASGTPEDSIREWCRQGLDGIFGAAARDVLFEGYIAYIMRGCHDSFRLRP